MIIKNKSRNVIVDEINFVINKMDEASDPEQKLYYFSGVYAIFHRIFNQDFDEDLVFVHLILVNTYESFLQRLKSIGRGGDRSVILSEEHFSKLAATLKNLAAAIETKKDIDNILKKFVILSYSTTGNGFYLLQKGLLKI